MNFFNILSHLAEVNPDVAGRLDTRRAVFNSITRVSKRTALAAAPALLASFFNKAYAGATPGDAKEIFIYALKLEQLEADFYNKMIAKAATFATASTGDQDAIRQIARHEAAHVSLLTAIINGIGGTPTTGNTFKRATFDALTSFQDQLNTAQLLEDTGVRAYKGRATDLQGLSDITIDKATYNPLETALRIHSVEARHAAQIRMMRNALIPAASNTTPWINGNGDLDSENSYKGAIPESTTLQAGVNLIGANAITPNTTYSPMDAQASFDEVLTPAEVLGLVGPFIGA